MNKLDDAYFVSMTMKNPKDDFLEKQIVGIYSLESDARIAFDELKKTLKIPSKIEMRKGKIVHSICLNGFIDDHGIL